MLWLLGCVLIYVVLIKTMKQMVLRAAELMKSCFEDLCLTVLYPFLCPLTAALTIYTEVYAQLL